MMNSSRKYTFFKNLQSETKYYENTLAGWRELEKEMEQWEENEDKPLVIGTVIAKETQKSSNSIFNLQYFLICADRLYKKHPDRKLVLIIKCEALDDVYRVNHYLYIQAGYRENLIIAVKQMKGTEEQEKNIPCREEYTSFSLQMRSFCRLQRGGTGFTGDIG